MMGLEPTTLGTTNRCSNQLSYIYRFGECNDTKKNRITAENSARHYKLTKN